jgi:hypothetical protein
MVRVSDIQMLDIFSPEIVEQTIRYYNSIGTYRSETMKKADPGDALAWIDPILRKHFPEIGEFIGGNFYKHKYPYLPHTDHQKQWGDSSINIVVPLWFIGSQPSLVVFDQTWSGPPVTWTMTYPKRDGEISSSVNGQLLGCPGDYDIGNHTDDHVDYDLAMEHLQFPEDCYYGMSGVAFTFAPGSAIMFDNSKIHCTSKFIGEKLGLSLRYKPKPL